MSLKQLGIFLLMVAAMAAAIGMVLFINKEEGGKTIMLTGVAGLWLGIFCLVAGLLKERRERK
jgi:alanine dehydrogenase